MAVYGTSALVHARLNIADSITDVDDKITDYLKEAVGLISENDFVGGIKRLVENGIIKV